MMIVSLVAHVSENALQALSAKVIPSIPLTLMFV